jgi:hypothetical protein
MVIAIPHDDGIHTIHSAIDAKLGQKLSLTNQQIRRQADFSVKNIWISSKNKTTRTVPLLGDSRKFRAAARQARQFSRRDLSLAPR